jgi:polyhydroxybutyrate depolymerase
MRHLWLFLLPLLACSTGVGSFDGGRPAPLCFAPLDGGVMLSGLVAPVPGCSRPAAPTGVIDLADAGWSKQGGVLVVPPSAPGTPLPVVFAFHGAFSSGEIVRARMGLEGPADGGAIFIYPNAVQGTWDLGPNSGDGRRVDTLLGLLAENYCIDPRHISIAGFSAGAVFTLYLGCNVPGTFHSMAVVAGTNDRFDTRCCLGALSAIHIQGTQDDAITLVEGQNARDDSVGRDHCGTNPSPLDSYCVGYSCPAPLAVNYCEWAGDHDIPAWGGSEIWRFVSAP